MNITLNLTDEAANSYAVFKGYQTTISQILDDGTTVDAPNPQSAADFITGTLLASIQNDLIEKRNRDAIAVAQAQPVPIVTPDQVTAEPAQQGESTNAIN